ncbi:hypothetical protein [Ekhidna sp.]|uniref:hypothetical protein n=1 Tax=Ekhidna sp. TaxID=2608089 RepID=UPI003B5B1D9D
MEWIKIITPLVGVLLGWGLSERAKIWADKRQDKRKLRRLLFFVLELRFHFSRELRAQTEIDKYFSKLIQKAKLEFGDEVELGAELYKPMVTQILKKHFEGNNKIDFLEQNIDEVIISLSEVFPVFAYELNGQYNIRERLQQAEDYLGNFEELTNQLPFDIEAWIKPKLTENLLDEIDSTLRKISNKVGSRTWSQVQQKIKRMDKIDDSDIDNLVVEYFDKIKENLN